MSVDQNLLLGVLALQMDLIDSEQFAQACTLWSSSKQRSLGGILVEQGWMESVDREDVERMLARRLARFSGDARSSLSASLTPEVSGLIRSVEDEDVRRSLDDSLAVANPGPDRRGDHELVGTIQYDLDRRDRYTLTRLHGEGGVGQVWIARDDELGRDVALKELRDDRADHGSARARFIREARVTGQLEHPGIVPVYELANNEQDDRPFYTMKLVGGRTMRDVVADYHELRLAGHDDALVFVRLLSQFVALCQTVDYAHNRGVIHRDLKTENVMLGEFGETVLLDWGLARKMDEAEEDTEPVESEPVESNNPGSVLDEIEAVSGITDDGSNDSFAATMIVEGAPERPKMPPTQPGALAQDDGEGAVRTMAGQIMGTPAYMAPEQAEGRIDQIDGRTDVYGLGAVLYEILCGSPPFSGDKTLEVLKSVVHQRPVSPRSLVNEVPRPLEAVTLKALEKQSSQRYQSAGELAADVERYLADESVSVLADPLSIRLLRWARRHRTLVTTSVVLLVGGLVGLSVVLGVQRQANLALTHANNQTNRQRDEAERQRDLATKNAREAASQRDPAQQNAAEATRQKKMAETHFRKAREVVDRYLTEVSESQLLNVPGLQPLRRDLLELAMQYHESFAAESSGDVQLQRDLGNSLLRIGFLRSEIEQPTKAIVEYLKAEKILKTLLAASPDDHQARGKLLNAHFELGRLFGESGKMEDAGSHLKQASDTATRLVEAEPGVAEWKNQLARVWRLLGQQMLAAENSGPALDALDKSVEIHRQLATDAPSDDTLQKELAETLVVAGVAQRRLKLYELAFQSLSDAKQVMEVLVKREPKNPDYQQQLSSARSSLALTLDQQGKFSEALKEMEAGVKLGGQLVRDHPRVVRFRTDEGILAISYGAMLRRAGKLEEAGRVLQRGVQVFEELAKDEPEVAFHVESQGKCLTNLANVLFQRGKHKEAVENFGKAIEVFGQLVSAGNTVSRSHLQLVFRRRATILRTLGRHRESLSDWIAVIRLAGRNSSLFLVGNAERARAAAGDHARAVGIIKQVQKGPAGRNPSFRLHVACVLSLASRSALVDNQLDEMARKALSERYAVEAVAQLQQAHKVGVFRAPQLRGHLKKEPDLDPLRKRADFVDLLEEVEKTPLKKQST
ncbi:MAG: serine/threonine-protein kinase [Planctomycetota bacterium]|nr:serine/threonine-protein kinase [Planctomycetota bacterium]